MNRTDRLILKELSTHGPLTADDLAYATCRYRDTVLRSTRRMWLNLLVNREPIQTGRTGRPRMRYMLGLGANARPSGESRL